MEKLTETGINLRKAIAMGMHDEMYAEGGTMKSPMGAKSQKAPKPMKMDGDEKSASESY